MVRVRVQQLQGRFILNSAADPSFIKSEAARILMKISEPITITAAISQRHANQSTPIGLVVD